MLIVVMFFAAIIVFSHSDSKPGMNVFPQMVMHTYGKYCNTNNDCSKGEICEGANRMSVQKICVQDYNP